MSVYSAYRHIRSTMVSLTFKSSCYIITIFDGCLSFEHFVGLSGVPRKNNILEFSNVLYMDINRVKFEKQCRQNILFKGIALTTLVFLFFFLLKKMQACLVQLLMKWGVAHLEELVSSLYLFRITTDILSSTIKGKTLFIFTHYSEACVKRVQRSAMGKKKW